MMMVKDLVHLKELAHKAQGDMVDFYIVLAGGLARSCKRIRYRRAFDEFVIVHEIDESFQELPADELGT